MTNKEKNTVKTIALHAAAISRLLNELPVDIADRLCCVSAFTHGVTVHAPKLISEACGTDYKVTYCGNYATTSTIVDGVDIHMTQIIGGNNESDD